MNFYYQIINYVLIFFCLFLSVNCAKTVLKESVKNHNKHVVCFVGTWAIYRPLRGSFDVHNVNGELCSHVVYAFAGVNDTTMQVESMDPEYDLLYDEKGSFKRMTELKKKYPHLKVFLGIGGSNVDPSTFSKMASKQDNRRKFELSVLDFLVKFSFDGADLDWEFPTKGGNPKDRENFAILVKELKERLQKKKLGLSASLSAVVSIIERAYDIPEISKHLDIMNFMTFDYNGPWNKFVGHIAPLRTKNGIDVESTLKHVLRLGAPSSKVVMGIACYGRTYLVDNTTDAGIGSLIITPAEGGHYTRVKGFIGYNEICSETLRSNQWRKDWDIKASAPFAVNGSRVLVYENPRSVKEKVTLGLKLNIGGFMMWSIDTDDFIGDCSDKKEGSFPLLKAVNSAIQGFRPQKSASATSSPWHLALAASPLALLSSHLF